MASLLAARTLLLRRPSSLLWTVCAGSASVFLALVDILFNLGNGLYHMAPGTHTAAAIEVLINFLTLSLGVVAVAWGWRSRREILGWDSVRR